MPSASRIEALSGSRRFAFSSGTVAWAAMPLREPGPAFLEEVVGLAHGTCPRYGKFSLDQVNRTRQIPRRADLDPEHASCPRRPRAGTPGRARTAGSSRASSGRSGSRSPQSGAPASGLAGSSSRTRVDAAVLDAGRAPGGAVRAAGRAARRSRRPRRSASNARAKPATSPGVNTVSAPHDEGGRRRAAAQRRRRPRPPSRRGAGCRANRTSSGNARGSPTSASTCSARWPVTTVARARRRRRRARTAASRSRAGRRSAAPASASAPSAGGAAFPRPRPSRSRRRSQ